MDLNLTVLAGRVTAEPSLTHFESGRVMVKALVTVRSEGERRRIDVIPVVWWDPSDEFVALMDAERPLRGRGIWIAGQVQRRFWSDTPDNRRSVTEVVAHEMRIQPDRSEADDNQD